MRDELRLRVVVLVVAIALAQGVTPLSVPAAGTPHLPRCLPVACVTAVHGP